MSEQPCLDVYILREIAHKLNFTYDIVMPEDGLWGTRFDNVGSELYVMLEVLYMLLEVLYVLLEVLYVLLDVLYVLLEVLYVLCVICVV